jgi:hypothetical protein
MWPHSINAQLASASKHTLQASSEDGGADDDDSIRGLDDIDRADVPIEDDSIKKYNRSFYKEVEKWYYLKIQHYPYHVSFDLFRLLVEFVERF